MEEKYLIATLFTNFDRLYTVQPGNTDFRKSQSQCILKVISQSQKVSKYFKPKNTNPKISLTSWTLWDLYQTL